MWSNCSIPQLEENGVYCREIDEDPSTFFSEKWKRHQEKNPEMRQQSFIEADFPSVVGGSGNLYLPRILTKEERDFGKQTEFHMWVSNKIESIIGVCGSHHLFPEEQERHVPFTEDYMHKLYNVGEDTATIGKGFHKLLDSIVRGDTLDTLEEIAVTHMPKEKPLPLFPTLEI